MVQGNPRVYKALKTEFATVLAELKRIEAGKGVDDELLSVIELISIILGGLKGEVRMENKKEMTIPNVSAATDAEQSLSKCTDNSIVNQDTDFKGYEQSFEEMQREILRQLDPSYLKTVSMTTLYDTVFEVQTPLIDGLLQRGTYLFVGSPKVGKSFMMAQLAYHISTGTPLWEYKVRKATVLYFALEDDYPRLQKRLFQMFGAKETGNLYFATECKTVNGGLEEQIRGFMREHPDTGLIIIDTLKRVREAGGADYSYASDYDVVARLKALADSYKVSMLIVHHTRKQKSEDIFDMISGTNGLMGAADSAFVLSKDKRTSKTMPHLMLLARPAGYENPSCKGQRAIGVELCKIGNGDVERTARTSA